VAKLLYLVHRLPYPPNKGDKVRSYHLLRHLVRQHEVHLGTFIDDPDDEAHLPVVQGLCATVCAERLQPRRARVASLAGLLHGQALSVHYYRSARLRRWVADTVARHRLDAAVVFSSTMAPYLEPHPGLPMLLDMVDVDSAKWAAYAPRHRWPMSWLYRREAERLLVCEQAAARAARTTYLATPKEAELFRSLAPDSAARVQPLSNGVDTEFFVPHADRASPFRPGEPAIVFTGAMDYWPNVDAVCWFASEVLPALRARHPGLRFHIVGRAPTPAVLALAADPAAGVQVTGTVPDVRPYLQHASVVVAPLRLARGIQNKILEAMAMARPVVAASTCVEAMTARDGQDLLAAESADDFIGAVDRLLADAGQAATIGRAGRAQVLEHYGWDAHLAGVDRDLAAATTGGAAPAASPSRLQGVLT
jgi:polysaccharide biosynthesis protein PslH